MPTLLDSLSSLLQGDTLSQVSRQVGADEGATSNAIAMALPVLVAGLARNASTSSGAQSLEDALDGDHDGSLLDSISSLLNGQSTEQISPRALNGGGILEKILGGRRAPVEQNIGKASGLNLQQAGKLMALVAPLVMAYLGRRKREQSAGRIGSVLQDEQADMERRAPGVGGILEQIMGGGQSVDENQMQIFGGLLGRKKSRPDFSDVQSGSSSGTAGVPHPTAQLRTYTVVSGDSLSKIAQREYGMASKWQAIFDANRDQISDPDMIHPGQVLKLPAA